MIIINKGNESKVKTVEAGNGMDTKQIMYFIEVADNGSFSSAAKALSVTQPALSIAVQKLEEKLGFPLFTYNQKNLCLTNNGQTFYKYAKEFADAYNHMVDASVNIKQGVFGSVTIVASSVIARHYLSGLLTEYHEKYPEVELSICSRSALHDSFGMLDRQEADFSLCSLPVDESEYGCLLVKKQKLVLGVHKTHPLAEKTSVAFADLRDEIFLDTSYDYNLHRQFLINCEKAGFSPKIAMRSNDMDFLASLVNCKWGIFMMPRLLWEASEYPDVRLLDITGAAVDWDLGLVYKKNSPMSNACQLFWNMSRKYFQKKTS